MAASQFNYNVVTPLMIMVNLAVILPIALGGWNASTTMWDFALVAVGAWLALRFVKYIQEAHRYPQTRMWPSRMDKIVRQGIYAKTRQPVIAGVIYLNIAYVFLFRSLVLLVPVSAFIATWYVIARFYEMMLSQRFGSEYSDYCTNTGMLTGGEGVEEWNLSGYKVN